jgi:phenylalanyl-tRNA synthetase alpha chain
MANDTELSALETTLFAEIGGAGDLRALEEVRIGALGKKGRVSELMATLGKMPPEQRKSFGQAVNGLKDRVSQVSKAARATWSGTRCRRVATEKADITAARAALGPLQDGRIHPVVRCGTRWRKSSATWAFRRRRTDIETDDPQLTKLNIPPEHPARQDHDTFYMRTRAAGSALVLRTHTSPVQIRTMMRQKPPIRIIAPGRVYAWTATPRTRRCSTRSRRW